MTSTARRLWQLLEPVHAVTYFAPECLAAPVAQGLEGFWSGYVVQRAAPLGAVGPAVVTGAFFGFHPSRIAKVLPDAWDVLSPAGALRLRTSAAAEALRALGIGAVDEAADLAWTASQRADTAGRVLAAANQALPRPDDPLEALWQATTTLREHRGDGHLASLLAHGLGPVEAQLLKAASGEAPSESLRLGRSWTEQAWAEGLARLEQRGLVQDGELTEEGREQHESIEDVTDLAASDLWEGIDAERLATLLRPLALRVIDSGVLPMPNPIGVTRPALA